MATFLDCGAARAGHRGRLGAVMLIVAAVGLSVAVLGVGARFDPVSWPGLTTRLVLPALFGFGLLGLYFWLGLRTKPTALRLRGGSAFVAPPNHLMLAAWTALQLTFAAFMAGVQLPLLRDEGRAVFILSLVGVLPLVGLVGLSVLWVVAILRDGIRLELRPAGLLVVTLLGRREVPWTAVAVGPSPRPGRWDVGLIGITGPGLVRTSGWARPFPQVMLPLPQLGVRAAFLVNAINHYLLHPEHRAAIGTPEEHERLQRAMAVYTG